MSEKRLRTSDTQKSWGVENKQVAANRSAWNDSSTKLDGQSPLKVERSFEDTVVNLSSNHSAENSVAKRGNWKTEQVDRKVPSQVARAALSRQQSRNRSRLFCICIATGMHSQRWLAVTVPLRAVSPIVPLVIRQQARSNVSRKAEKKP